MTSIRGTQRLAALLAERTNIAPDEAVELIGALDRSPIAIGRLATQLEQVSGWPSEVAGGTLVHDLEEILRARGINIPVRACVACGETGPMTYTGPVGASCKRCGPQGEQLCPAGRHSIKIGARCVACRDENDVATLAAAVRSVGVTEAAASDLVRRGIPGQQSRRRAAAWIADGGQLSGDDPGPASVQKLRALLVTEGFCEPVRCARCGQARLLRYSTAAGRLCTVCYRSETARPCAACGRTRPVAWRDSDDQPWCGDCRRDHPDTARPCSVCGEVGPILVSGDGPVGVCCYEPPADVCVGCGETRPVWARRDDGARCRRCFNQPLVECVRCGEHRRIPSRRIAGRRGWCVRCCRTPLTLDDCGALLDGARCCADCGAKKLQAYLPDGARCSTCYDRALRRRDVCSECGDIRRVFFHPGVCGDCLGVNVGHVCTDCGVEDRLYANGRCPRCELAVRAEDSFSGSDAAKAVAERITRSSNPRSALRWLDSSASARSLRQLLEEGKVTHDGLDGLYEQHPETPTAARHDVEYARSLLIAAEVLPPRSELQIRFARWADASLAEVTSPCDRWLLRRFVRELLLPTVVRHELSGKATTGTVRWAQARLRAAARLLKWLAPIGGLQELNRARLDEWVAGGSSRYTARDFVLWAVREQLCTLPAKAVPQRITVDVAVFADHDERVTIARDLLAGEGHAPDLRVAGLLVVLYGQHLSRIAKLRRADVMLEPARMRLGEDWLHAPDPLGQHLKAHLSELPEVGQWLFPGIRPGDHISEGALARRVAAVGIRARQMRNAALFHLSASVQPHTLYRLLGLHPNTAVDWGRVAGSIYVSYWEAISAQHVEDDLDVDLDDLPELEEDPTAEDLLADVGLAGQEDNPDPFW